MYCINDCKKKNLPRLLSQLYLGIYAICPPPPFFFCFVFLNAPSDLFTSSLALSAIDIIDRPVKLAYPVPFSFRLGTWV